MKTNVPIELNDIERNQLAIVLAGKQTAKKVSRAQVCEIAEGCIASLLQRFDHQMTAAQENIGNDFSELLEIDPCDAEALVGKSASYIMGWNKAKKAFRK